jgi:hypothetical protein
VTITEAELAAWSAERRRNLELEPDETAKVATCGPCKQGQHVDHHHGVWRRFNGSAPVVCRCARCVPDAPGVQRPLFTV